MYISQYMLPQFCLSICHTCALCKKQLNTPSNLLPGQKRSVKQRKVTNFVCFFGRLCMTWTILPGGYSWRWSPVQADGQSLDPVVHNVSDANLVSNCSNIRLLNSDKGDTILHYKPNQPVKCTCYFQQQRLQHHSTFHQQPETNFYTYG